MIGRYLTEHKELDLNLRDQWDSTPLYYACLCGHLDLVKYLLNNGAVCDSNTFEGERCVYGALTDAIRKLLLDHKMLTTTTKRREAYTEFLRRLWQDERSKDVTFNIHGETVRAHKFLLSTRSSLLRNLFEEKWRLRKTVILSHRLVTAQAFRLLLEYLYTGQCKVEVKQVQDLTQLVKYCKLRVMEQDLEEAYRKADSFGEWIEGLTVQSGIEIFSAE